jgi:lysophospholipase L1-like esterase
MTRRRGMTAAEDPGMKALLDAGTSVVTIVGKTSAFHVTEVLGVSREENLAMIFDTVRFLTESGREVFYDAEHFFDGWKLDRDYSAETIAAAARAGATRIVLCDTNGGTLPDEIAKLVAEAAASLHAAGVSVPLAIHCHNDCDVAIANSLSAVAAGAVQVQGTINGFGERTGNCNLISVMPALAIATSVPVPMAMPTFAAARAGDHDLLMIGDSITHNFEKPEYQAVWNQFFAPRKALNLGYSGGRTENTLWNLQNGELEGQHPKVVTLLIGTNNSDDANYPVVHDAGEIYKGTAAIVALLREKLPDTKILLLKIFPRTNTYKKADGSPRGDVAKRFETNQKAGELVAELADDKSVFFLDVNHVFLKLDGTIDTAMMPDQLHPSPAGAKAWAEAMEPLLSKLFGDEPKCKPSENNAIVPVSKLEKDFYDWWQRHADVLNLANLHIQPQIVLIGDSITHFWGGIPNTPNFKPRGGKSYAQAFEGNQELNLGFGWDRTQNVLWRLAHGEFAGRKFGLGQGEIDDLRPRCIADAVPDAIGPRGTIGQGFGAAALIAVIPAIEGLTRDAEAGEAAPLRQVGLLHQADNFELFGGRVSHARSSPSAIMFFLSRRSSSVCSATTSFSARVSWRSALTSSLVAARGGEGQRR